MISSSSAGFDIYPEVISPAEAAALADALNAGALPRTRAGARHLMKHPRIRDVASDPRLLALARRHLAADPVPYRATLFDKSGQHNWLVVWHQDTALPLRQRQERPGWGPWSVKDGIAYAHAPAAALSRVVALRLHLDDSRLDNGPLRVLPGTHLLGLLSEDEIARLTNEIEPVNCLAPAGGVVAMRPLILHASSKAQTDLPRRVLHIEYADSLTMADGLELTVA